MNIITACCITLCFLIISSFTFFTIVYLSELKRERTLRKMMLDTNDNLQGLLNGGKIPVVIMDMPINKQSQDSSEQTSSNKDKKSVN